MKLLEGIYNEFVELGFNGVVENHGIRFGSVINEGM